MNKEQQLNGVEKVFRPHSKPRSSFQRRLSRGQELFAALMGVSSSDVEIQMGNVRPHFETRIQFFVDKESSSRLSATAPDPDQALDTILNVLEDRAKKAAGLIR